MADLPTWLCWALLLLVTSTGVDAGAYCLQKHYSSLTYCHEGCCGSSGSQYCCGWSPTVGLIVGCVLAGIVVIAVIIAIVCCCIKQKAHGGQVISPAGAGPARPGASTVVSDGPVTVSTFNTSASYYPPPQPPVYQPPAGVPQTYDMSGFQQPQGYAYGQGGEYGGHPTPAYGKGYME